MTSVTQEVAEKIRRGEPVREADPWRRLKQIREAKERGREPPKK